MITNTRRDNLHNQAPELHRKNYLFREKQKEKFFSKIKVLTDIFIFK